MKAKKGAKKQLNPEQLIYAEWLAKPDWARIPHTELELAKTLNITPRTLRNWRELSELWEARDNALDNRMRNLVPQAAGILEKAVTTTKSVDRIALDAAKQIIKEWGESRKHSPILSTLADLREKYELD